MTSLPAWVRAVQELEPNEIRLNATGCTIDYVALSTAELERFVALAEGVARLRGYIRTFVSTPHPTHIGPLFEAGRSMVYNEVLANLDKLLEEAS